jgi:predicted alpha/beta hydrolase family esterase
MKNEIIILVHGFFKNKKDMAYLEKGLRKSSFNILSVNLPTTFGSIEDCVKSLHIQVNDIVNEYNDVSYVAHSMGGLIVRDYIKYINQNNVRKCIFIATPHSGSKLARIAKFIPFYTKIFKPIQSILPDSSFSYHKLNKNVKVGLIAGNRNKGILGKLFLSEKSDGRVDVCSVKAGDANEMIVLPFGHKEIHKKEETLMYVKRFLLSGTFGVS